MSLYGIIGVLIFILFAFYLFLKWRTKSQLNKLKGGYNEEEDKSRPSTSTYNTATRGAGVSQVEQGDSNNRPEDSGTEGSRGIELPNINAAESRPVQLLPTEQSSEPKQNPKRNWPKFE